MEHAIWIKKDGSEEYVHIKKLKAELGEDDARREKYKCPSKKCGVKMITVFPKQVRRGGKETHSDHFRASPEPHAPTCGGDGEREGDVDDTIRDETDKKPRHTVVKRASYPMRYVKRSRSPREVIEIVIDDGGGKPVTPGPLPPEPPIPKVKVFRDDSHTSEPETGHIRGIVDAYENPPEELHRMKLSLPECAARNYQDAIVGVGQAVNRWDRAAGHYIYKGNYREHRFYGNGAISITFSRFSGDGRKLGVWLKPELEPEGKREEIKELLKRAEREKNATVYVFGKFQSFSDWKYSVEIEAFGDLWITFPTDSNV